MKIINKAITQLEKTKKSYLFLFILVLIGVITGCIFFNTINNNDKVLVVTKISDFMSNIKNNNLNHTEVLKTSLITNLSMVIIMWLLGISIIGCFINVFITYLKGFIFGFIISGILYTYKSIGLIGIITYTFPHYFINIIVVIVMTYFSLNISKVLLKSIIQKQSVNLSTIMKKYYKILLFSICTIIISSLFETFISPYIIKLFTLLIK